MVFSTTEKSRTKHWRKTLLNRGLKLLVALEGEGLFHFLDGAIASNHIYLNTNKNPQVFSQVKQFCQTAVINIFFRSLNPMLEVVVIIS